MQRRTRKQLGQLGTAIVIFAGMLAGVHLAAAIFVGFNPLTVLLWAPVFLVGIVLGSMGPAQHEH